MRLIDADVLQKKFEGLKEKDGHATGRNAYDLCAMLTEDAPTVDAVVLPCKIGDDVYIIPSKTNFDLNAIFGLEVNNRVHHQKIATIVFTKDGWYMTGTADAVYGTGRIYLDMFYKETWFLTREEAEAVLAKMKG